MWRREQVLETPICPPQATFTQTVISSSWKFWWICPPEKRRVFRLLRWAAISVLSAEEALAAFCRAVKILDSPSNMAYHRERPTWTFSNRAGDAPCPTCMTWIGSPLPQLGTP